MHLTPARTFSPLKRCASAWDTWAYVLSFFNKVQYCRRPIEHLKLRYGVIASFYAFCCVPLLPVFYARLQSLLRATAEAIAALPQPYAEPKGYFYPKACRTRRLLFSPSTLASELLLLSPPFLYTPFGVAWLVVVRQFVGIDQYTFCLFSLWWNKTDSATFGFSICSVFEVCSTVKCCGLEGDLL